MWSVTSSTALQVGKVRSKYKASWKNLQTGKAFGGLNYQALNDNPLYMKNGLYVKKPVVIGLRYGLLTMLFSHIPILLICFIQWARDNAFPTFDFIFDSGGIIAIWIPLMAMLLFSFYEVKEYRFFPGWEWFAFFLVLLMLIVSTAIYTCFFFEWIPYRRWVMWLSIGIIILLFALLSFSRYLESSAPGDLPESRMKDQNQLDDKLSKMITK